MGNFKIFIFDGQFSMFFKAFSMPRCSRLSRGVPNTIKLLSFELPIIINSFQVQLKTHMEGMGQFYYTYSTYFQIFSSKFTIFESNCPAHISTTERNWSLSFGVMIRRYVIIKSYSKLNSSSTCVFSICYFGVMAIFSRYFSIPFWGSERRIFEKNSALCSAPGVIVS